MTDSPKYVKTTLNLPAAELEELRKVANEMGLSMTTVVRLMLQDGLTLRGRAKDGYAITAENGSKTIEIATPITTMSL